MLPGPLRITRPGHELSDVYPAHRELDAYWQERQISAAQLRAVASRRLALLMTGGWDEYNTPGNLDGYEQYRALSGPTYKRMVIAPTGHTTPGWLYRPLVNAWMDQFVKGTPPAGNAPPVILYIRGAERWRAEAGWPIPDTRYVSLKLGAAHSGPAVYDYDPDRGPFLHVMISQSVAEGNTRRLISDQRQDEARVATWTTAPLQSATEITGNAVIEFWASSSIDDADFVASLSQVAPDGTSRQIVQGYLNGPREAYTRSDPASAAPQPLVPGQPRRFTLRLLPTATVVPAGTRLRLSIGGGADIGIGNDGKPQNQPQGPGKNPRAFRVSILQDGAHPAALTLPIIGTVPPAFIAGAGVTRK
jgi:putative CocE/NonD family hydrolase